MSDAVVIPHEEDTAEEAQLRSQLEQTDRISAHEAAPDRMPEPDEPQEKAQKDESPKSEVEKEEVKSDSSEPEAETDGRERDEKGRFLPKSEPKVEKGEVKELVEGQPEVEQPKPVQNKDEARLARSWQKIEQEKLEVRNALAEVRQLKEQLQQQAQRAPQAPQPRFSSKDYMAASDEFERQAARLMEEGDVDAAKQKLDLARQSRMAAQQYGQQEQTEAQQAQTEQFTRVWQGHAEAAIKEHPELGDPSTPEAQAMMELLEDFPVLGQIPDGFRQGVEFLKMRRDAASYSELRTKYETLEKENKELRSKTAISGGGVTPKVTPKDFDSMTLDEQEHYLERLARSEDYARTS